MSMFFTGASANTFKYNGALVGIPATCSVGDLAFITNATAGQQIYECSSTNTWTQQGGGSGGFTAPDNWTRANGHWTGGGNSALIPSTYTLTSDGLGASNLFAFNLVATAVSAAGGAGDVKVGNITSTVTGPAQAGSTWANTYNTGTFNLTSGNLTHGLQDIQRATMTSTAGTTTDLFASGYFTAGLVNANGATLSANVMNVGWDGALSGTGTITDMATIVAGAPGAITGSPTVTSFEGIVAPDVGNSTVPGTSKAGISIGGQVSGGIKTALFIPASSGTYTNSFYISGLGYFGTGFTTGAAGGTINGNFTAANTTIQVSTNTTPNTIGWYNGNAAHEVGQLTTAGIFGIRNSAATRNDVLVDTTGSTYLPQNKTFIAGDFTTSGVGTALEATGLTFTLPANLATNVSFSCYLVYHQNSGTAAVAFGVKNSVSPTQLNALGYINTSATAFTAGNLTGLASTTATNVVSATPSVITTNWNAEIHGMIEQPSGSANTVTILVSTATAGDTVTVKRGSYCVLGA
jgi:hypothetical protein